MNKNRFFELLANTDDDLLLAADQPNKVHRPPVWLRFTAATACLCVLLAATISIVYLTKQPVVYTYSCYEIAGTDCDDGGAHTDDHPLLNAQHMNYHQDPNAPPTASVSFNGITYTGEYRYSYVTESRMYLVHKYKSNGAYFEIEAETGNLCAWSAILPDRPSSTITTEQCRPIADQIACQFLNLEDYQVRERIIDNDDNYFCKFTYYKEIDGLPTTDSIIITIDGNGKLASVNILKLHSANLAKSQKIDRSGAQKIVEEKLDTIYANCDNEVLHSITLSNITVLDNGDIALFYSVNNTFVNQGANTGRAVKIMVVQSTPDS